MPKFELFAHATSYLNATIEADSLEQAIAIANDESAWEETDSSELTITRAINLDAKADITEEELDSALDKERVRTMD